MTDTNHQSNPDEHEEEESELLPDLWVENSTNIIHECQFFDGFVLLRPCTPSLYLAIRKLSNVEFMEDFEPFCGNRDHIREFMRNAEPHFIIN